MRVSNLALSMTFSSMHYDTVTLVCHSDLIMIFFESSKYNVLGCLPLICVGASYKHHNTFLAVLNIKLISESL